MSTDTPTPTSIAIFASSFAPHLGGVEELVRQLAREFRGRGIAVIVLTNRWPRDLPGYEVVDGTQVYRVPFRVGEGSLKAIVSAKATSAVIHRRVRTILQRHAVDLVHVQCVSSNGLYALRAAQTIGLPLVVTAQGERTMDATQVYQRSPAICQILRALLDQADVVTACSQAVLDDLEAWHQPLGVKGVVVHNGVAAADVLRDIPPESTEPHILALGRLVPQKGFDVLIRAYAVALREDPGFRPNLVVAGSGPEEESLAALVRTLSMTDRVHLTGPADRDAVAGLLGNAICVALPSRHEPFGIVGLEALAAGRPLIASRTGGIPEYVRSGENGLLVEPGDVDAWAVALRVVAGDSGLRARLAREGLETGRHFTWPSIADRYLALYATLRNDAGLQSSIDAADSAGHIRPGARDE